MVTPLWVWQDGKNSKVIFSGSLIYSLTEFGSEIKLEFSTPCTLSWDRGGGLLPLGQTFWEMLCGFVGPRGGGQVAKKIEEHKRLP